MNAAEKNSLETHEAVCAERYSQIKAAIESLRNTQARLFEKTDDATAALNRLTGKLVIIEAIMFALLALGIYEMVFRPVFAP